MKKHFLFILACLPMGMFAQEVPTLISNTNVLDVRTGKVSKETSVLIKDGFIQEVFINKKYKLPSGTTVLDGTGKYLIPGMTDGHIHFSQSGGLYTRPDAFDFTEIVPYAQERRNTFKSAQDFMLRYLRMGITTVADVGGPMDNFIIGDSISKNNLSPTVLVTGPLFSMVDNKALDAGDPIIVKTTTISSADSLLDKLIPKNPDYIKIWYIVSPQLPAESTFPVVAHIAKRAHVANLKLAVHATELRTAELAVKAGADILVHSVEDEVVNDAFIKNLLSNKVSYIPTLTVVDGYITAIYGNLKHNEIDLRFANPFFYSTLSDPEHLSKYQLPVRMRHARAAASRYSNRRADSIMAINLKKLWTAGINVVAGTDAGNVGTMHASSFIAELEAMKNAGLTRAEVLRSATLNSAVCFKRNSGLIQKGRIADMVMLTKNPLDDLHHLTTAEYLIKDGKIIKADTLIQETPEMLVQRQVNAYNAHNLEAFLDTYSDDVELYDFPNTLTEKGKDAMRKIYGRMFKELSNLHCQIVKRIVLNDTVIDHEHVRIEDKFIDAIAIYDVKDGKIVRVTFKQ